MEEVPFLPTYLEVDEFSDSKLNINFHTLRIPFTKEILFLPFNHCKRKQFICILNIVVRRDSHVCYR